MLAHSWRWGPSPTWRWSSPLPLKGWGTSIPRRRVGVRSRTAAVLRCCCWRLRIRRLSYSSLSILRLCGHGRRILRLCGRLLRILLRGLQWGSRAVVSYKIIFIFLLLEKIFLLEKIWEIYLDFLNEHYKNKQKPV